MPKYLVVEGKHDTGQINEETGERIFVYKGQYIEMEEVEAAKFEGKFKLVPEDDTAAKVEKAEEDREKALEEEKILEEQQVAEREAKAAQDPDGRRRPGIEPLEEQPAVPAPLAGQQEAEVTARAAAAVAAKPALPRGGAKTGHLAHPPKGQVKPSPQPQE
jgi:hypothetical protein